MEQQKAGGQPLLPFAIGGQRLPQKMVPAAEKNHKAGQRCFGWKGTPANWLPASEEPHLLGSNAQEAKGDGAMGQAHKQAARARRVIHMQSKRSRPAPALASATYPVGPEQRHQTGGLLRRSCFCGSILVLKVGAFLPNTFCLGARQPCLLVVSISVCQTFTWLARSCNATKLKSQGPAHSR